jgi:hypothetical protein
MSNKIQVEPMVLTFHIMAYGDSSVGIPSGYNKVTVQVDEDTNWMDEDFVAEFIAEHKKLYFDFFCSECGGAVLTEEEYQDYIEAERRENEWMDEDYGVQPQGDSYGLSNT